jgi:hypothetical protein
MAGVVGPPQSVARAARLGQFGVSHGMGFPAGLANN